MNMETRGRDNIRPIFSRLRRCQDRPEFMAVKMYNKLPLSVRSLNVIKFKMNAKNLIIQNQNDVSYLAVNGLNV